MSLIKKILSQTLWQLVGKIVNTLTTLFVLGLVTRSFGEEGTGLYTLVITYLIFFHLACDLSLNAYFLAKNDLNSTHLNKLLSLRVWWALILVVLSNMVAVFLPFGKDFQLGVLVGSLTNLFFSLSVTTNLIFQHKLHYQSPTLASILGSFTVIPITWVLISIKAPAYLLLLGPFGGWIVNNITSLILVNKFHKFKLSLPDIGFAKEVVLQAWPLSLTLLINTVYFRIDSFILSYYHGLSSVGIYNLGFQIFQTALVIPTFIMNSFYPLMINLLHTDKELFYKKIKLASVMMLCLGSFGAVLTYLLSPFIISLITDQGFEGSILSLRLLSLSFPAFFLSSLLMWTLVTLGRYKIVLTIYTIGLLLNLILNYLFIPQYSYIAASIITGVCEYLILAMQIICLVSSRKSLESSIDFLDS